MQFLKLTLLAITMIALTACGTRVPFKEQQPLENSALVYVYVKQHISTDDDLSVSRYKIRINNKQVEGRINSNEHMVFNVKPQSMTFSATRAQIEEHTLSLTPKTGNIYYLRVVGNLDGGQFEFAQVSSSVGGQEIQSTGLSGSTAIEVDSILTELVDEEKDENVIVDKKSPKETLSKVQSSQTSLQEIEHAYKLKEQGILTQAEFDAMKAKILAK